MSYYDYYQPEAYVPSTDTYIEKDSSINDEIDKLRHSATAALSERNDVIIVASVSCIYGLGSPIDYKEMVISLRPGMIKDRDEVIHKLIDIQYSRNDMDFKRGSFRVRGDTVEIFPAYSTQHAYRVEFFGDEVDRITEIDTLTGEIKAQLGHVAIFPASHYVVSKEKMEQAAKNILEEMRERVAYFKSEDKLLEAQRIAERTNFDVEMMRETGFCSGIENYSRHLVGSAPGEPPCTLIDYFPDDFLIIIDESHITLPQIRGMYAGDRSRKMTLVEYGFRLPSALDNRPLNFGEFESKIDQMLFVSATPSVYEAEHELLRTEQIIRPTGLLDPKIDVRPVEGQIDDLISEVNKEIDKKHKVLVTTLTKRMAEDLTDYMREVGIRVKYLHSDIDTLERAEIIRDMRLDVFDVLVGINLLREGLDIPEIALVAILDADKEGFLRSEVSLIHTDRGPCGKKLRGPRHHVRRHHHRFHAGRYQRDRAKERHPAEIQRGARHHADHHQEGGARSHQHLPGGGRNREQGDEGSGVHGREGARQAHQGDDEEDAPGGGRAQFRGGRQTARRDDRVEENAPGAGGLGLLTIILDKSTISEYKSENKENHMKLYEGSIGSWYLVEQVRVDEKITRRLEALGINEKTRILILNKKRSGTVIIKVRGTRLAIGQKIADGIEIGEVTDHGEVA